MKTTSDRYLDNEGKKYFDYQNQGGIQRGRINARKFQKHIGEGDFLLDFGCANGSLLMNLNCRRKIGVEVNPAAREVAKSFGIDVHETLDEILDDSIDVVISNHVLEHTLSPHQVLGNIHRKLKPGGRLIMALPIDDWRTQKVVNLADINHHLYTWTPLLIGNLLSDVGYVNINAHVYSHAWPPAYWQVLDRYLPIWAFDLVCRFVAWRDNRRQLMVFAKKRIL